MTFLDMALVAALGDVSTQEMVCKIFACCIIDCEKAYISLKEKLK